MNDQMRPESQKNLENEGWRIDQKLAELEQRTNQCAWIGSHNGRNACDASRGDVSRDGRAEEPLSDLPADDPWNDLAQ